MPRPNLAGRVVADQPVRGGSVGGGQPVGLVGEEARAWWTRTEAYLKAVRTGIAHGLSEHPAELTAAGPHWTVHNACVPRGYAAAVALRVG